LGGFNVINSFNQDLETQKATFKKAAFCLFHKQIPSKQNQLTK